MPDKCCTLLVLVLPQDAEGCRHCSQLQHLAHEPRPVPGARCSSGVKQVHLQVHLQVHQHKQLERVCRTCVCKVVVYSTHVL
jgi:hypothetical protein